MKENRFNQRLTQWLRKSKVHYIKVSDRTTVGISDFLIWHEGMSAALEVKRILRIPTKPTARLLAHPFSKPQVRFLKNMHKSGNIGYGLISIHQEGLMFLVDPNIIPDNGNWTVESFMAAKDQFKAIEVNDFKLLFRGIFYDDEQIRRII